MMKVEKILLLSIGIVGIFLFYKYSSLYFPTSSIRFEISREQAKQKAIDKFREFGYDTSGYYISAVPKINNAKANYFISKYGLVDGTKKLANQNYSFFQVRGNVESNRGKRIRMNDGEPEIGGEDGFVLNVDPSGNVFFFKRIVPDTMHTDHISVDYANILILEKLKIILPDARFKFEKIQVNTIFNRQEILFRIIASGIDGRDLDLEATLLGPNLGSLKIIDEFEKSRNQFIAGENPNYIEIISVIIIIILLIIMLVITFRRFKNDEINFKSAFVSGISLAFVFSIYFFLMIMGTGEENQHWYILLVPTLFLFIIFSLVSIVIFTGTESVTRYSWNEKFYSLDAIRKKYFYSNKIKEAFFNGLSLSGIYLLIVLTFYFTINQFIKSGFEIYSQSRSMNIDVVYGSASPYAAIVGFFLVFSQVVMFTLGGICFLPSLLKTKIKNVTLIAVISILILSFLNIPSHYKPMVFSYNLIYNLIIAAFFVIMFLRYDIMTVMISFIFGEVLFQLFVFDGIKSDYSSLNFEISLGIVIVIIIVFFIVMLLREKEVINYDELAPKYLKRMTERERISKEIEAARHIQKSFLPYTTPNFPGLDIFSNCVPAYEVGGDYYDYFVLEKDKIGIVIADVSGKGVKAAFYMTLIKGIIKAQTQTYSSPKDIVSRLNKLLFEIIEKGNFISLIYCVFDMENKSFLYCNAGHNPLIYKNITHGNISYQKTSGLALGLADEKTFNENVEEKVIMFRPGDLFILYTDGFTEAMNKSKQEYGEISFLNLIDQFSNLSPSEIVSNTESNLKVFIGKAEQHDDMTLVVIRVK